MRLVHSLALPRESALHLLGSPALVGLAHIRRRLDGRDVLEGNVDDADDGDDGAGDLAQNVVVEEDGADKDIDCYGAC